ncbi:HNH endonuclease [Epibacterium sp. MM17-32]|uniref:HNH endonuclease n=1 Tax=Epibacterium sp. MM17-32 TaxID=2917734 RepID=UPI001EF50518|nr:HNH endonuclease [Epibacterium sp. MM17-32]MCG7629004.1 HNH endonuclease [Epibacterium sp. MM17-32]
MAELPDQDTLQALLRYEPDTGKLFWKERPLELCKSVRAQKIFNTQHAGKEAFTAKHPRGYRVGAINRQNFLAHRVIWKLVYGTEPDTIDHDNGDPGDNRLDNLVDGTQQQNTRNQRLRQGNTLGVMGVYQTEGRAWQVRLSRDYIGTFPCLGEAILARKAAETRQGFHPHHGRRQ